MGYIFLFWTTRSVLIVTDELQTAARYAEIQFKKSLFVRTSQRVGSDREWSIFRIKFATALFES